MSDGNGTGIERITLRRGDGVLSLSALTDFTVQASYNASCCSQIVEIVAVDKVGNVGTCYQSIVRSGGPPSLGPTPPLWMLCVLLTAWMARS